MIAQLPAPLTAYFAAKNQRDTAAMLAAYDDHAVVKDEGHEYHGRAEIRTWIEDTTRKYAVTADVKEVATSAGKTVVSALISGSFPGSPAMLRYTFTLADSKITQLECKG